MKIVFMGTPAAAAKSLGRLIDDGHEVVAVYTQPDRPAGRGKHIALPPVKELALTRGRKVFQPSKIKTFEALDEFRSHAADIAVVVAYGRILPETFLTAFRYGALNVHFSLLPKYRGAAPVNWAIVNGEAETGVTVMQMDAGLDTGDILLQRYTPIGERETSIELMDRLGDLGAEAVVQALEEIDSLKPVKQNEAEATFAPILRKDNGLIDWGRTAIDIERRVRGFQPFPSSYTFHNGSRLTIWAAEPIDGQHAEPGKVVTASGGDLIVSCGGETALRILEVQPEGKRRMPVRDFLNGSKISQDDILA